MGRIKLAIVGVGNCASSLVQGLSFYADKRPEEAVGLMHWEIGGYRPQDVEVAAAFDVDLRKVGKDVAEAIFERPNCTAVFNDRVPKTGVRVRMGRLLDGVSEHMDGYPDERRFIPSDQDQASREEVIQALVDSRTDVLVNYLPVGSEEAARFYAECALEARVAVVNCIPVFIASDPAFAARFAERGVPIIGDDIKAQLGATITHRMLTDLFAKRGVKIERTYQLNTGGNTDFLNMLNRSAARLEEGVEDRGGAVGRGERIDGREHPRRPERLRGLAERQQGLLPADGRPPTARPRRPWSSGCSPRTRSRCAWPSCTCP